MGLIKGYLTFLFQTSLYVHICNSSLVCIEKPPFLPPPQCYVSESILCLQQSLEFSNNSSNAQSLGMSY